MISEHLPYEEHHVLVAILRHHHIDNPELEKHLAQLGNWIHVTEQAKFDRTLTPPFPLVLLSGMGIYGSEVLTPPRKERDEN